MKDVTSVKLICNQTLNHATTSIISLSTQYKETLDLFTSEKQNKTV